MLVNSTILIGDSMQKSLNKGVWQLDVGLKTRFLDTVHILCKCRQQLMISYIFTYSIEPHTQKEIFEMNQNDLQSATDKLSKSLYLIKEHTNENARDKIQKAYAQAWYVFNSYVQLLFSIVMSKLV